MRPRFPLSHRACYERTRETRVKVKVKTEAEGGLPTAVIPPETGDRIPQFLIGATPQF